MHAPTLTLTLAPGATCIFYRQPFTPIPVLNPRGAFWLKVTSTLQIFFSPSAKNSAGVVVNSLSVNATAQFYHEEHDGINLTSLPLRTLLHTVDLGDESN